MVRQWLGWWVVVALLVAGCATARPPTPVASDQVDVWFMQHTVPHLRETTVIVSLTREQLTDPELARLADTVTRRSQADIDKLQGWLDQRGLSPHGHSHQPTDTGRQTDLERISRLRGSALDLVFVQVMKGRSRTASKLAATEADGGTVPAVRQLARQMLTEQQAQIARMTAWKRARSTANVRHPAPPERTAVGNVARPSERSVVRAVGGTVRSSPTSPECARAGPADTC